MNKILELLMNILTAVVMFGVGIIALLIWVLALMSSIGIFALGISFFLKLIFGV